MATLSPEEWDAQFQQVEQSMLHLELRSFYASGDEHFQAWVNGDRTPLDRRWPIYADWLTLISGHTGRGIEVARARVMDEPPSLYQRWESWCAHLNAAAGETVWLIDRSAAQAIGLDPEPQGLDWWLFDHQRVMYLEYDAAGQMSRAWVTADLAEVAEAERQWALVTARGQIEHSPQSAD